MFFLNPATFLRLFLLMFPYSTCELHWLSSNSKYFSINFRKRKPLWSLIYPDFQPKNRKKQKHFSFIQSLVFFVRNDQTFVNTRIQCFATDFGIWPSLRNPNWKITIEENIDVLINFFNIILEIRNLMTFCILPLLRHPKRLICIK